MREVGGVQYAGALIFLPPCTRQDYLNGIVWVEELIQFRTFNSVRRRMPPLVPDLQHRCRKGQHPPDQYLKVDSSVARFVGIISSICSSHFQQLEHRRKRSCKKHTNWGCRWSASLNQDSAGETMRPGRAPDKASTSGFHQGQRNQRSSLKGRMYGCNLYLPPMTARLSGKPGSVHVWFVARCRDANRGSGLAMPPLQRRHGSRTAPEALPIRLCLALSPPIS